MNFSHTHTALALGLAVLLSAGCSAKDRAATSGESPRLLALASMYVRYQSATGRPPADEQQLKSFISERGAESLQRLGVNNADELFTSERDGQPFVVIYGRRPAGMATSVVAYEREGVDGKRLVGHSTRMIEEADQGRFAEIVPSALP